jgi:hypothetical protein
MLQRGAVANAFNQYGATPLHWVRSTYPQKPRRTHAPPLLKQVLRSLRQVASEDFPAIARLLLKYGAEPNAKACDGCTAVCVPHSTPAPAVARATFRCAAELGLVHHSRVLFGGKPPRSRLLLPPSSGKGFFSLHQSFSPMDLVLSRLVINSVRVVR